MSPTFHYELHSKSLGDKLIRGVLQHATIPRGRKDIFYQKMYLPDVDPTTEIPTLSDKSRLSSTSKEIQPSAPSLNIRTMSTIWRKETTNVVELPKITASAATASAASALLRKRRRNQQRRYRKKKLEYTENLETEVREIQEEIRILELQLAHHSFIGISGSQTCWGAAIDYFRLFRHGFQPPTDVDYTNALELLKSFMAPNVKDGLVCGPDALLTGWMLFSCCFDDICVNLQRLEKGPVENSITATVTTSITITTASLRLFSPHLMQNGGSDGSSNCCVGSLVANLLGQRLVMRGSVVFEWDDARSCVNKMQSQSDMVTPLLRVLGNLEDVSRLFEGAFMTPDCCWSQVLV